jgi:hypothetical protein
MVLALTGVVSREAYTSKIVKAICSNSYDEIDNTDDTDDNLEQDTKVEYLLGDILIIHHHITLKSIIGYCHVKFHSFAIPYLECISLPPESRA